MKTDDLIYWINEREAMRARREGGEPPRWVSGYSPDRFMGLVRYCNVRREDDLVTRWMGQHWRKPDTGLGRMVLARMINYIPSLNEIVDLWGLDTIEAKLKDRRTRGQKVFTSAYTISTCGQRMDKIDYVMMIVESAIDVQDMVPWDSCADAFKFMTGIKGLGSFLAGQVIADFKNTKGHPLANAPDWDTWSCPGPGSLKGLSAFYGYTITPSTYYKALDTAWLAVKGSVPPMHMQDFQNCMCEFSKYMRVREGGHVRNRYAAGKD